MNKVKLRLFCGGIILLLITFLALFIRHLAIIRERARRSQCMCIKQLGLAMHLYESDRYTPTEEEIAKGKWPYSPQFIPPEKMTDLNQYIGGDRSVKLYFCPSHHSKMSGQPPQSISELIQRPEWMSYDFLDARDRNGQPLERNRQSVLCDKPGNHGTDGITMLTADAHVFWWAGTLEDYARSNNLVITVVTNWVR